jgi:DNA polymerase-3 subunit epsilon
MNFVALDVETANPDFASICQVGVVAFQNGNPGNL